MLATQVPQAATSRAAPAKRAATRCSAAPPPQASRRALGLALGGALGAALLAPGQARRASAFLGFGGKSEEETYVEDTTGVITQMKATLALPKDDPALADNIAKMRQLTNAWVAKYRRNGQFTGRSSYGNTYSALNAVAGHYNNFGTKYQLPAKRAERALKELADATLMLPRGR